MLLSETVYLYFFLPVFMGLYAIVGAKKRPLLIAAANVMFTALYGVYGLIVFAADFALVYFSAIIIYNDRKNTDRLLRRRIFLAVNLLFNAAVFVCLAHTDRFALKPFSGVTLFGAAVIPLHAVSYIADVYRGDCEAQTRVTPLAAYLGFFPSAGFGPVLKYKNFRRSFEAPAITHEKAASGIRCYVFGLAEYLLVAHQLEKICGDLGSTGFENLRGAPMWLGIVLFCVMYSTKIMGLLHMGQGTAMLLGFPVKRCFKRQLFRLSVYDAVCGQNLPLAGWVKDYIYRPIYGKRGIVFETAALLVGAEAITLWYGFGLDYAAAGLILFVLLLAERVAYRRLAALPKAVRKAFSAAAMLFFGGAVFVPKLAKGRILESLAVSAAGSQSEFLVYLISISAPLMIVGILILSNLVPRIVRRSSVSWFRAALPVTELLLIIFSTAFMITNR